jgi:hypothetical protein
MSREQWISAFVWHIFHRGFAHDADWATDVASEVYSSMRGIAPEAAAEAAFDGYLAVAGSNAGHARH